MASAAGITPVPENGETVVDPFRASCVNVTDRPVNEATVCGLKTTVTVQKPPEAATVEQPEPLTLKFVVSLMEMLLTCSGRSPLLVMRNVVDDVAPDGTLPKLKPVGATATVG